MPERDVSLANTLGVESVAAHFHRLANPADLPALLEQAHAAGWPVWVLGEGSNVVLARRLPGLVIQQACKGIELVEQDDDSVLLSVAAGENWHGFVGWCLARGYHGLENLALIPGTVGAAPIQNIGAYGVEVGEFIDSVCCRDITSGAGSTARPGASSTADFTASTGTNPNASSNTDPSASPTANPAASSTASTANTSSRTLSRDECRFGYRDSIFKGELRGKVIIESVRLRLRKRFRPNLSYPSLAQWLERQGGNTTSSETPSAPIDSDMQHRQRGNTSPNTSTLTPTTLFNAVVAIRQARLPDPSQIPNAGSFFRNPQVNAATLNRLLQQAPALPHFADASRPGGFRLSAAWLIEQCGFKDARGPVRVHPQHALVIINPQRADASAIQAFAAQIVAAVESRFGLTLEQEPSRYDCA